MRQLLAIAAGMALVCAVASHWALLVMTPQLATDRQISEGLKRGGEINGLWHNPVATAGSTSVPLANPDSLTSRSYLDLSKGPLVLRGPKPKSCVYWSASIFAHNTDAIYVRSDKDFPGDEITVVIGREDAPIPAGSGDIVKSPSDRAVLLLRCFMRDRTDPAHLAVIDSERRALRLERLEQTP